MKKNFHKNLSIHICPNIKIDKLKAKLKNLNILLYFNFFLLFILNL